MNYRPLDRFKIHAILPQSQTLLSSLLTPDAATSLPPPLTPPLHHATVQPSWRSEGPLMLERPTKPPPLHASPPPQVGGGKVPSPPLSSSSSSSGFPSNRDGTITPPSKHSLFFPQQSTSTHHLLPICSTAHRWATFSHDQGCQWVQSCSGGARTYPTQDPKLIACPYPLLLSGIKQNQCPWPLSIRYPLGTMGFQQDDVIYQLIHIQTITVRHLCLATKY